MRMTYRKRVMVKAMKSRSEAEIDDNLEGSFPASDPPSWTLGSDHRPPMIKNARTAPGRSKTLC